MTTWTDSASRYFWLTDLAGRLGITSTARVFTFGYDATPIFGESAATISDIANNLLNSLRRERADPEVCLWGVIMLLNTG